MIESAVPAVIAFAEAVAAHLFAETATDHAKDVLATKRRATAVDRTVTSFIDSMEPFFSAEMSDGDALSLATALRVRFTRTDITPTFLATHHFDLNALTRAVIGHDTKAPRSIPESLHPLLDDMTRQALKIAIDVSKVIPDWERVAWRDNFKALAALQEKLDRNTASLRELASTPSNRACAFEEEYKSFIARELSRFHIKGIGNIGDAKPLSLEALFTHVTVKKLTTEMAKEPPGWRTATQPDSDLTSAVSGSKLVVVLGAPGAGKSTISQLLALKAAQNEWRDATGPDSIVPFLIRVRTFNFGCLPTPQTILEKCAPLLADPASTGFVLDVFKSGRGMLIVDGLDECQIGSNIAPMAKHQEPSERDRVIAWIEEWVTAFPDSRMLITSRPVGYKRGSLTNAGFSEFEIMPLSEAQQGEFIDRWCYALELSVSPESPPAAKAAAISASSDLKRRIASAKSVRVLAYNPLMLFVICILHRYRGQRLPERKVDLLNDCVNVLLYDFRSAAGVPTSVIGDLDAKELRALLEPVAWQMTLDGIEQASDEIIRRIFVSHLPEINQPSERANEIIGVIRDRAGVLIEVGPSTYSFMHLLFQEYLAAEECARTNNFDILLANASNPRWREIVPMAVAASKSNQETLIRALLQKGAVAIAATAMAMLERAPVNLRSEVTRRLAKYPSELKRHFDSAKLAGVAEIGTAEAAEVIMKVVLGFRLLTTDEFRQFAAKWQYGDGTVSVLDLASNLLIRALRWKDVDLGESWGDMRDIGYYSDYESVRRGATWTAFSLGLKGPPKRRTTTQAVGLGDDPIYNYAVILDVCEPHRGYLAAVCWQAFSNVVARTSCSPEKKLMALHFAWYFADADANIDSLLDFLSSFPPTVSPSFQIGLLNNAVSRVSVSCAERVRGRAEDLWLQRFDRVVEYASDLIAVWEGDLVLGPADSSAPVSKQVLIEAFENRLRAGLQASTIFPRE